MVMAALAAFSGAAESVYTPEARDPCVMFHKYVGVRFFLEVADGILAHRPGGCMLSVLHDACNLWALSWRFLRDLLLGLLLTSCCMAMGFLPFASRLHTYFLFRTLPRQDDVHEEQPDPLGVLPTGAYDPLRQLMTKFSLQNQRSGSPFAR